jgi:hypothetical protein
MSSALSFLCSDPVASDLPNLGGAILSVMDSHKMQLFLCSSSCLIGFKG